MKLEFNKLQMLLKEEIFNILKEEFEIVGEIRGMLDNFQENAIDLAFKIALSDDPEMLEQYVVDHVEEATEYIKIFNNQYGKLLWSGMAYSGIKSKKGFVNYLIELDQKLPDILHYIYNLYKSDWELIRAQSDMLRFKKIFDNDTVHIAFDLMNETAGIYVYNNYDGSPEFYKDSIEFSENPQKKIENILMFYITG